MSSWLSVGKSFSGSSCSGESRLQVRVESSTERQGNAQAREEDADHRKKKKEKKHKKDKKEKKKKHKGTKSRVLVQYQPATVNGDSSDSFSSDSSEEDGPAHKVRRLLASEDVVNGNLEVAYLPNGEVALIPRKSDTDQAASGWLTDRRADKELLLYEGTHPKDVVRYNLLPDAAVVSTSKFYTVSTALPNSNKVTTSWRLLKEQHHRPSGIMVSALQQHKDYATASKTAQIFLHRQQRLGERNRELRLQHQHRYFSRSARNLLEEPSLRRLKMRRPEVPLLPPSQPLSATALLPFPFVEVTVLQDLGFSTALTKEPQQPLDIPSESAEYTSAANKAQHDANCLVRETNQVLREGPQDLATLLRLVSLQDSVCILQRVAAGRSYNALVNGSAIYGKARNKADIALQRAITERKVAVLEQALGGKALNTHTRAALHVHLLQQLERCAPPEEVQAAYNKAVAEVPLDVELRLQKLSSQLGQFGSSSYGQLVQGLQLLHSDIALTARNLGAAQQLTSLIDASLYTHQGTGVSRLQQQYSQARLEGDLQALRCDLLYLQLLLECGVGHRERAVALVQAVLDMNLSRNSPNVADFCAFWDSECARLGEGSTHLSPGYLVDTATSEDAGSSNGRGYDAWIDAGRPTGGEDAGVPIVASALGKHDDSSSVMGHIEPAAAVALPAASSGHAVDPSLIPSGEPVTRDTEAARNQAAADLFLQQILGSADVARAEGVDEVEEGVEGVDGEVSDEAGNNMDMSERWAGEGEHARMVEGPEPLARAPPSSGEIVTEPSITIDREEGGEEEGELVYSRLHGYKIRLTKEHSGHIYRKILSEIAPDKAQAGSESSLPEDIAQPAANYHSANAALTPPDVSAAQYTQYRQHQYASLVQWRPLRAVSDRDAVAAEEQPERVVFSDDIRSALFSCSVDRQQGVAVEFTDSLSQAARQRLMVRCLQGLGVRLPHCEVSHAAVCRMGAVLSPAMRCADTVLPGAAVNPAALYSCSAAVGAGWEEGAEGSGSGRGGVLHRLRGLAEAECAVCTVDSQLLKAHAFCGEHGYDSQLNFAIRLVGEVIGRACSRGQQHMLSTVFLAQLKLVLLQLLTMRLQCERKVTAEPGTWEAALQRWRSQCRALLESSVEQGGHSSTGGVGSEREVNVPPVGDLELWSAYLNAEQLLGQEQEALKLADKVLKSLNSTDGEGCTRYRGHEAVVLTALSLAVKQATPQYAVGTALLVQYAHSGAVGPFNPTCGLYEGELRPSKKGDKNREIGLAKVGKEVVQSGLQRYQSRILELAEQLHTELQAEDRVRATEKDCTAVRIAIEDCAQLQRGSEICHFTALTAWLQCVSSGMSNSTGAAASFSSLAAADEMFTATIALVRGLLLRHHPEPQNKLKEEDKGGPSSSTTRQKLLHFVGSPYDSNDAKSPVSGLAELCFLHGVTCSSSAEVTALVTIERLHRTRLSFLLSALPLLMVRREQAHRDVHSLLLRATAAAQADFPHNTWFLTAATAMKASQPGGVVAVRAALKAALSQRPLWGSGLTAAECVVLVQVEVLQANKMAAATLAAAAGLKALSGESAASFLQPSQLQLLRQWTADDFSKVRRALEFVLSTAPGCQLPCLWSFYVFLEACCGRQEAAKKVFFRAVNHCGWSHDLYAVVAGPCLKGGFSEKEQASLVHMLEQRGVRWLR